MMKVILPAAALALALSPVATAETGTPFTVDIAYDRVALADDTGAAEVLASIKSQARSACYVKRSIMRPAHIDYDCVDDVSAKAINKILEMQTSEGLETSDVFASQATFELADAGQR